MNRRTILGLAGLALLTFAGVRTLASDMKTEKSPKPACACCGDDCSCPVCSCEAKDSKATSGCDCCGTGSCCDSTADKK